MLILELSANPKNQDIWKQVARICNFDKHTMGILYTKKWGLPREDKKAGGQIWESL